MRKYFLSSKYDIKTFGETGRRETETRLSADGFVRGMTSFSEMMALWNKRAAPIIPARRRASAVDAALNAP